MSRVNASGGLNRLTTFVILLTVGFGFEGCNSDPQAPLTDAIHPVASPSFQNGTTGNGAPNGRHYNLNIIGVPKEKSADMTGNNGHRIFVPLSGTTKIWLTQGDFAVIDANGTDGNGAAFQLPNPDPDNDGVTAYSVYARALGKPGGRSTTTTCATDLDGNTYCSVESMILVRSKGKSSFTNVSKELLYIYADIDGDGTIDRIPLFDSRLQDYFWNYDNNGLKLAQLRFYEIPTTVP